MAVNDAAASCEQITRVTFDPLQVVDRPSADLARFLRAETVLESRTFQSSDQSVKAPFTYRGARSAIDVRTELQSPVNRFPQPKAPQVDLAIHACMINQKAYEQLLSRTLNLVPERGKQDDQLLGREP